MEEVKLVLKPAYNTRKINKEAYKEILRKTVPKVLVKSSFVLKTTTRTFHHTSNFRFVTVDTAKSTPQK